MNTKKTALASIVLLYFVICLEILIMISPFAGFFYSAFNPFLLKLTAYPATRWLTAFFLPHMVIPTTSFLMALRIFGSLLLLGGMGLFLLCALQVYTAKFRRRGTVLGGLYRFIRHPQYLGLAAAGAGLAILWPRFLVVVLWCFMVLVYFFLARDEEKRMLRIHNGTYRPYMENTGMFLPRSLENFLLPTATVGRLLLWLAVSVLAVGTAFCLRSYTIHHLTLHQSGNVTAIAILPDDGFKMDHRLTFLLNMKEIRTRLTPEARYLVYFLPKQYIMQGLIADTGGDWKLYKKHHTISMITDWILHPVSHLSSGHHAMMHHGMDNGPAASSEDNGVVVRRLIFLRIDAGHDTDTPLACFDINASRTPLFLVDVELHSLKLLDIRDLPLTTGWGYVPTPTF